jgi:predicted DsbA family dithiol-disulfide isomerase
MYDRVAAECDAVGLPFRVPERVPNTRRVLETAEYVRLHQPDAFDALDASLFRAHFADGLYLGDPEVLDALVRAAGGDAEAARAAVEEGAMHDAVTSSMTAAYDLGIAATPTWVIEGAIVPGLQSREFFERVVRRLTSG